MAFPLPARQLVRETFHFATERAFLDWFGEIVIWATGVVADHGSAA